MWNFIKLNKLPISIVAFVLYTVLMVFGGWKVHTYYVGYQQNLEAKVEQVVKDGISTYQRNQAQGLEDTKNLLKDAKTNTIIKESTIVNRPIYMQQCIDQAGVDLLKQYREDSKNIINGTKKNEKN
ncbi:Rz-like spanin [Cronobacter phage vB_CsaM_GAP32]|uniref:Putative membrane protein n=1 Tax=Cronobacter phage vB_CsaM_GAP32 TaxID=1141136 RepID=K4F9J2_9CAUD|nr:Rz-like spanin [Cronobacter phage vB_CsaM_GAP32]AFC21610.1 putative membrane protein [Cronobacter phage vB_CsaM_GAP32]